jgi:hypothetical protein
MFYKILALVVFIVVSPVSDAINGYFKYPEGSCSALAVLSPSRMAFLCADHKIIVGQVTALDLPDPYHPACAKEFLLGLQAMATLKFGLFAAQDIRTTYGYRENGIVKVGALADHEGIESIYLSRMQATTRNRTRGDWCST